ncbi:MAG: aminotransferase class V-fold PLP-dependent enzyme [Pirellulales bacterium]|nr:aminotransferase class V-fold PLP-dependent enzyme [Pirellulales bacterium]
MTATTETRNALREQMPIVERWAYFDHAAVSPLPQTVRDTICTWADEAVTEGNAIWPMWDLAIEQTRSLAAQLIAANREEIALVLNTTTGINLVAEGYPWRPGDNVILPDDEFPSNAYPWLNLRDRGVEIRRVPTDRGRIGLTELDAACDDRTQVVSISWVAYANGFRRDLAAIGQIAHRHGALFFVDAIQGLGVFPLDVKKAGIDCLAADGHKWMLAPEGAAIAYFHRDTLARLAPRGVGWHSVVHAGDFTNWAVDWKPAAERYEGGSQNIVGTLGLGASLQLLLDLGVENLAACILEITDFACDRLEAAGARIVSHRESDCRSGIVSFLWPGHDPIAVRKHCIAHQVLLSCRDGRLRMSPHAYNNEQDVDRLIEALQTA